MEYAWNRGIIWVRLQRWYDISERINSIHTRQFKTLDFECMHEFVKLRLGRFNNLGWCHNFGKIANWEEHKEESRIENE